ncbi:MAG: Fur family transcriptional regulator [Candidatus Aminicenantales bacterium]|jgi:Fur family peroxide stress response transcriptional regulator
MKKNEIERVPAELKTLMSRFRDVIKRANLKLTHQRIVIYGEAARTADHPTVETIYRNVRRKMPTISLDTVYRTLDLFRDLGLVSTLRPLPDRVRFDANTETHHHFICIQCGLIRDFYDRDLDAVKIPESAQGLGRVESAYVELRGVCPDCSKHQNDKVTNGTRSQRIKANERRRN